MSSAFERAIKPIQLLSRATRNRRRMPRAEKLYVDPALPAWLLDMTLIDLRLGRQRFDIRFLAWTARRLYSKSLGGKRSAVERKAASALRKK